MIRVRPVTKATWDDFARLFESKGAPHYCWCTKYRMPEPEDGKAAMRGLVRQGTEIGVLAYDGDEPVGWCSIAPRATYAKLRRSRTMPTVTESAWTVMCFFVLRARRGEGLAKKLLAGALAHARRAGAEEIEAYPYDTAGITATHLGHSSIFAACGFEPAEGRRWVWRRR